MYIAAMSIRIANSPKCFKEGTLVETEDGLKPIDEIQVGDKVLAYDEETGGQAYKPVLRLFRNTSQDWTGVTVNGEEIISTPKHKYYLPESKSWKSAEELKVGTKVLLTDGSYGIIEAVKAIHNDEPETTYNFEVADFHTYYVTESKVLVHNVCGQSFNGSNDINFESAEKLNSHFAKHGQEFGGLYQSANEYLAGANYVVKNGTYVSQMNGYVRFIGVGGKANYAFVGLTQSGQHITTFGVRSVSSLTKIPWLIP